MNNIWAGPVPAPPAYCTTISLHLINVAVSHAHITHAMYVLYCIVLFTSITFTPGSGSSSCSTRHVAHVVRVSKPIQFQKRSSPVVQVSATSNGC